MAPKWYKGRPLWGGRRLEMCVLALWYAQDRLSCDSNCRFFKIICMCVYRTGCDSWGNLRPNLKQSFALSPAPGIHHILPSFIKPQSINQRGAPSWVLLQSFHQRISQRSKEASTPVLFLSYLLQMSVLDQLARDSKLQTEETKWLDWLQYVPAVSIMVIGKYKGKNNHTHSGILFSHKRVKSCHLWQHGWNWRTSCQGKQAKDRKTNMAYSYSHAEAKECFHRE